MHRVLLTLRLPCPRPRSRKRESVTLNDNDAVSSSGGVEKAGILTEGCGGVCTPVVSEEGGAVEGGGGSGGVQGITTTSCGGGGDPGPVKSARGGSGLRVWSSDTDGTSLSGGGGSGGSPFAASGDGEWRKRKVASEGATAAAIAAAEGKPAYVDGGNRKSKSDLEGRRHRWRATAQPGRLEEYLRHRKKASVGMRQALQAEREARAYASEEYALALSDFESDHGLEITWRVEIDDVQ